MTTRHVAALVLLASCAGPEQLVLPPPPTPPSVPSPVAVRLEVTSVSPTVPAGGLGFLVAKAFDREERLVPNQPVTWLSRSPDIIASSAGGVITGVALGHAVIVARLGALEDSLSIEVVPAGLRITPQSVQALFEGDALPLTASWTAVNGSALANGPPLAWSNLSPGVVELQVPGDGSVATALGRAPGRAILTASGRSVTASVELAVFAVPVDGVRPDLVVKTFEVTEFHPDDYYGSSDGLSDYAPYLELAVPGRNLAIEIVRVQVQVNGIAPLVPVCSAAVLTSGAIRLLFDAMAHHYSVAWTGAPLSGTIRTATATITYRVNGGPQQQLTVHGPVHYNYTAEITVGIGGGWTECPD